MRCIAECTVAGLDSLPEDQKRVSKLTEGLHGAIRHLFERSSHATLGQERR